MGKQGMVARSVTYQIHLAQLSDSNADTVHRRYPGITSRLDHIADLGVDAIWLADLHLADEGHGLRRVGLFRH
ncbi:MAG: alpha-amylase family glycosyl hydrolase [Paracoccaceae bacterium]